MTNVEILNNSIFTPIIDKIKELAKQENAIFAIDGGSASGKTTLAMALCEEYNLTVFHMDDFFLPRNEQKNDTFGNIDFARLKKEVLDPLSAGKEVSYRRFDCQSQALCEQVTVKPSALAIIEGAYSMHPSISGYFDSSALLIIDSKKQRERIEKRNTPMQAQRFFDTWIPKENEYFEKTDIKDRCEIIINI